MDLGSKRLVSYVATSEAERCSSPRELEIGSTKAKILERDNKRVSTQEKYYSNTI
jgi:hypothetical protein